jgi:hypothetical protein
MVNTPQLSTYFTLLHEAAGASRAIDDYDLDSDDPSSVAAYAALLTSQMTTSRDLILYLVEAAIPTLSDIYTTLAET